MHHVFVREEVWQVNWKCLVENFMEGYHLSVVHPGSLHPITPTALCEKFPAGEGYTGYKAYYPETAPTRGDSHPELDARERRCSTLFCVYPCHVVSQSPDLLVHMALQPRGVNSVAIRWGASTYEADLAREEIDRRIGLWETVNNEDRFKLERMQVGLRSRHSAVGPLAPADLEGTIWDFFQYLSRQLGDDIRRAP
jgi:phenylpropionate dioxygenase-like ring-hydroxylating dioxygenase large terminal subunit